MSNKPWQQGQAAATAVPTPSTRLCDNKCRGINIESVTAENGYPHLLLSELYMSRRDYRLCARVMDVLEIKIIRNPEEQYKNGRYRIHILYPYILPRKWQSTSRYEVSSTRADPIHGKKDKPKSKNFTNINFLLICVTPNT